MHLLLHHEGSTVETVTN